MEKILHVSNLIMYESRRLILFNRSIMVLLDQQNVKLYLQEQQTLISVFQLSNQTNEFYSTKRNKSDLGPYEHLSHLSYPTEEEAIVSGSNLLSVNRMLLTAVQNEFNRENRHVEFIENDPTYSTSSEEIKKLKQAKYVKQAKQFALANIRLIGELYLIDMLQEKAVQRCVLKLLRLKMVTIPDTGKIAAQTLPGIPDEEDLEALCKLLATVGKKIDETTKTPILMDACILRMIELSDAKISPLSSRLRFMLIDIVDLRDYSWQPRREEIQQKTLSEIRREAFHLQQMGKNAQHESLRTMRFKSAKTSEQLAKEQGDLLIHGQEGEEKEDEKPQFPEPSNAAVIDKTSSSEPLDANKISKRIKNILEEYASLQDEKECIACVEELPKDTLPEFIEQAFNLVLESKANTRESISHLLPLLVHRQVLTTADIESGIAFTMEFFDSLAIDIPFVHEYAGLVFGKLLGEGQLTLSWLLSVCQSSIIETGLAKRLIYQIVQVMKQEELEEDRVLSILSQVKSIGDFFPSAERNESSEAEFFQFVKTVMGDPFEEEEEEEEDVEESEEAEEDEKEYEIIDREETFSSTSSHPISEDIEEEEEEEEEMDPQAQMAQARTLKGYLEEYIAIEDDEELCNSIEELSKSGLRQFIDIAFERALESNASIREQITNLCVMLFKQHKMSSRTLERGFDDLLSCFEDIYPDDIPQLDKYASEIFSPLLQDQALSMQWIFGHCVTMTKNGLGAKIMYQIGLKIEHNSGKNTWLKICKKGHVDIQILSQAMLVNLKSSPEVVLKLQESFNLGFPFLKEID